MFFLEIVARRPIAPPLGDTLPCPYVMRIFSQLLEKFLETVCQLYRRRIFGFRYVHASDSRRAAAWSALMVQIRCAALLKRITVFEAEDMFVPVVVGDGLPKTKIKGIVVPDRGAHAAFDVHNIHATDFLKSRLKALKTT